MPTAKKAAMIEELSEQLSRSQLTIVTDYRGLKVTDLQGFRTNLRPVGAEFHIAKNTLTAIAAGRVGAGDLDPLLAGPTGLVLAFEDPVQTAKVVSDFVRSSRVLTVRGALMGNQMLTAGDIEALATMPSREELQARLVGMLASPMSRTLGVLTGPARSMVYLLNAKIEQAGAAAAD
ncbi:MAG: 50S ribosomal protein L10 [Thermomicrobiales bacterium]|nr:50S ribosomal protein L10 [Thermomicrobiales bacterium]